MNRLYDIIISNKYCDVKELYYRLENCKEQDGEIIFSNGGTIKFNTYFNCISYFKLKKYTILEKFNYHLDLSGRFIVRIKQNVLTAEIKNQFSEFDYYVKKELPFKYPDKVQFEEKTIFEKETDGNCDISFDISNLTNEGYCYLELESLQNGSKFIKGVLETEEEKIREPKIAICITTFKREQYVFRNLENVRSEFEKNPVIKNNFDVIVVDNGQTLDIQDEENIRIIKNKNLGGSGGFTRGIMETYLAGKYTHFLLQDDDILFDPKILERVYAYISYARTDNLAIGAAMLRLDKQYLQYEMGANWRDTNLDPNNRGYDISKEIDVLRNEEDKETTYNAWWFMCQPVSVVDKFGLPLPLFIKADDIEYSLRTAENILTINGLGVWHESFDSKYSGELEYYVKRNEMIVSALYGKHHVMKNNLLKLFYSIAKELIYQRYTDADFVLEGFRDFLKGPKYLKELDGEKMHASLRARAMKQANKEELKKQGYDVDNMTPFNARKHSKFKNLLTLNGYLIPTIFYNKKEIKEGRLVPLAKARPKYFYKCKTAVQYDADTDRGFVTKQKRWMLVKYFFKMLGMGIRIIFEFNIVKRKYKKAFKEITSFENWNRILGL